MPAGSFAGTPQLAGNVKIGVAAGYVKGRPRPTAALGLYWPEAGLTVTSSSTARWLTVDDATARLAGTATVDGVAGYSFELTAVDGAPDRLRLVVWDPAAGGRDDPAALVLDTSPLDRRPEPMTRGKVVIR